MAPANDEDGVAMVIESLARRELLVSESPSAMISDATPASSVDNSVNRLIQVFRDELPHASSSRRSRLGPHSNSVS